MRLPGLPARGLRAALAKAFDVLDSAQREELDAVFRSDLLSVFDDLSYQPMTSGERALIALGIEELVLLRNMLAVGADTVDMAVDE